MTSIVNAESNHSRGIEPFNSFEPWCFDADRELKERCEKQCQFELQSCVDGGSESKESCYKKNTECVDCELLKTRDLTYFSLPVSSSLSERLL